MNLKEKMREILRLERIGFGKLAELHEDYDYDTIQNMLENYIEQSDKEVIAAGGEGLKQLVDMYLMGKLEFFFEM